MVGSKIYLFLTTLCCIWISSILAFSNFKAEIPNGDNVPNPCVPNTKWKAPGHLSILGGGKRNPFGQDFDDAGTKWTKELCNMDSDGDGRSNGLELGDEGCTWTKESLQPPTETLLNRLSHPGICEPMDSEECQRINAEGLCAQKAEYECNFNVAGVDNDVETISIQIDETEVPAQETTYICQSFNLEEYLPDITKPYHVVGSEPILVNQNVMHHMIVYACNDDNDPNIAKLKKPGQCGMATSSSCSSSIAGWTVGQTGECTVGDYGYRIGAGSYKSIIIEMHWNNPLETMNTYDSSGVKLYITPNIRTYDLGGLSVGQMNLRLEPGKDRIEQIGTCSSACTQQILNDKEIFLVDGNNHMHYLGIEGHLEILRNGQVVKEVAIDKPFEYDTPIVHGINPPLALKAGDEIRMKCVYKTSSRTNVVFYGDGTQAEMCFGFISYYPNILTAEESSCLDWGGADSCKIFEKVLETGCDMDKFWTKNTTWTGFDGIGNKCSTEKCNQACLETLDDWYKNEPCLKDPQLRTLMIWTIGTAQSEEFPYGEHLATLMRVCDKEYNTDDTSGSNVSLSNTFALLMVYLAGYFL